MAPLPAKRLSRRFFWLGDVFKQSALEWYADNAFRLSAALAYYTVFSLAPVLVLATAVAGVIWGDEAARGELTQQLQRLLGADAASAVNALVSGARQRGANRWATLLSGIVLIIAATGVFAELKATLNQIWRVPPPSKAGVKTFLFERFASFVMVVGIGFLLLLSLLVNAAIAIVSKYFSTLLPIPPAVLDTADAVVSLIATTGLFALIFKILPDTRVQWRDVWVGSGVTAILFLIGRWVIGLYIGQSSISVSFGASSSLAVLLVWSYYSAMIILFGAEFTEVFARSYGSRGTQSVKPRPR